MSGWKIIVTAVECETRRAEHLARRLQQAWSAPQPVNVVTEQFHELTETDIDDVHAIVIVGPADCTANTTLRRLTHIEESGVPIVAVVDGTPPRNNAYDFVHALVLPCIISEQSLCATLLGIGHRERAFRSLRQELSIAKRFHGGLEGQIAQLHEELQLAATVQRDFLPREIPSLHGVTFGALWRPTNYVSGDIYDIVRLDDDHVGMFLADAVGHGVPAALMTMVIVRSLVLKDLSDATPRIVPPSEVLTRLNDAMIRRQSGTTRFATAAYALVNCRERTLTYAGAGHPPPITLSANGEIDSLTTDGGLLGIFEGERYNEMTASFDEGTKLVMFSDGFEQAFPDESASTMRERKLPTDRYETEFQLLHEFDSPHQMISEMNRRLDDQFGSLHQLDDLTMLCLCAGPNEAAAGHPASHAA